MRWFHNTISTLLASLFAGLPVIPQQNVSQMRATWRQYIRCYLSLSNDECLKQQWFTGHAHQLLNQRVRAPRCRNRLPQVQHQI